MKRIPILLLVLGLLICASFAQSPTELKSKISKINKEIKRLQTKLTRAVSRQQMITIKDMIEGHQARVIKLEQGLKDLEKAPVLEETVVEEATVEAEVVTEELPEEAEEFPEQVAADNGKRFRFKIGGTAGLFSASTGAFGEIRFSLPYIFGPATTSLRLAGGLAQSDDTSRRYAPIMLDWIFNLPAGWFTGVENYVGLGLNYVVLTSGRVPGAVGGQVFYGVQSKGFGGKLFGEMGYGVLRTGFTPAHKGTTVLFGYRRDWAF